MRDTPRPRPSPVHDMSHRPQRRARFATLCKDATARRRRSSAPRWRARWRGLWRRRALVCRPPSNRSVPLNAPNAAITPDCCDQERDASVAAAEMRAATAEAALSEARSAPAGDPFLTSAKDLEVAVAEAREAARAEALAHLDEAVEAAVARATEAGSVDARDSIRALIDSSEEVAALGEGDEGGRICFSGLPDFAEEAAAGEEGGAVGAATAGVWRLLPGESADAAVARLCVRGASLEARIASAVDARRRWGLREAELVLRIETLDELFRRTETDEIAAWLPTSASQFRSLLQQVGQEASQTYRDWRPVVVQAARTLMAVYR